MDQAPSARKKVLAISNDGQHPFHMRVLNGTKPIQILIVYRSTVTAITMGAVLSGPLTSSIVSIVSDRFG
jgi:hypothetical protein